MITDIKRIENAQKELEKAFYNVLETKKRVYISERLDCDFAYDSLKCYLEETIEEYNKDIIDIQQENSRKFENIFKDIKFSELDYKRLKLNKKEMNILENNDYDFSESGISIGYYIEDKNIKKLEEKIDEKLQVITVSAHGYSQSDWEEYTFIIYKDTKNKEDFIKRINNIKHLFTICEYDITDYNVETREYKNKEVETVEVEEDFYSIDSWSGDITNEIEEFKKKGYEVITSWN